MGNNYRKVGEKRGRENERSKIRYPSLVEFSSSGPRRLFEIQRIRVTQKRRDSAGGLHKRPARMFVRLTSRLRTGSSGAARRLRSRRFPNELV
ncbi:unnamed protein product [Nesidiocoris tenuis]|uniref:Uncharacterized protein n=1 Tax=Nesidiocoris tenuis TaxID=355587 RepID=A0A6H5HQW9_9HEMI|nr:unnamed protein product [Nesidiocoris tenuis]